MIYLDTSVALAQVLAEDRLPPAPLWNESLISSRLLEYEVWNRVNARNLSESHGELVRQLIGRVALVEMAAPLLTRALEPFSMPVRTLDAVHLATIHFLREHGQRVTLASYDTRLNKAARSLRIPIYDL